MERVDVGSIEVIARHEAGHAVALHLHGQRVHRISLVPHADGSLARVDHDPPRPDELRPEQEWIAAFVNAEAGQWIEHVMCGRRRRLTPLEQLRGQRGTDDERRILAMREGLRWRQRELRSAGKRELADRLDLASVKAAARDRLDTIAREHLADVERVALALLAHPARELGADDLAPLLEGIAVRW